MNELPKIGNVVAVATKSAGDNSLVIGVISDINVTTHVHDRYPDYKCETYKIKVLRVFSNRYSTSERTYLYVRPIYLYRTRNIRVLAENIQLAAERNVLTELEVNSLNWYINEHTSTTDR